MGFGDDAVRLARSAVESEVTGSTIVGLSDPMFSENAGAFVTLHTYPDGDLRGCIGYPLPYYPLGTAIVEAGRSACHDPRFPDLGEDELDSVVVEVTVLSVPMAIGSKDREGILGSIEIGRDGLMLELGSYRGLFLPQVPVEQGWDKEEYLENLCYKAGIPGDLWMHPDATISRFTGEVWCETSPGGMVERREFRCMTW